MMKVMTMIMMTKSSIVNDDKRRLREEWKNHRNECKHKKKREREKEKKCISSVTGSGSNTRVVCCPTLHTSTNPPRSFTHIYTADRDPAASSILLGRP